MSEFKSLEELYDAKKQCRACKLRQGCIQVVAGSGSFNPILMIIAEAPGEDEDEAGEPFMGRAGECLRKVLRSTGIIKKTNTLITNVLGCRPPKNKFPKDDCPDICTAQWLWEEIRIAKPQRMMLLGGTPLKYVAEMDGITQCRGQWYTIRGVRTMPTFHPSYVLRQDSAGDMLVREKFERDIKEIAAEVAEIEGKSKDPV